METVANNMKLDRQPRPNDLSGRFSLPYAVATAILLAGQAPALAAGGGQENPPSWGLDRIDQHTGLDQAYHYASDAAGVTVYVIDTGTGQLIKKIPVGKGPHGLALFPQPGRFSMGHTGNYR